MASIDPLHITESTPVSSFFVDESGAKHSKGGFFVVGMVKLRDVGDFFRGVRDLRAKHQMYKEMKFSEIRKSSTFFYFDIAEYMAASPIRIGASVYDSDFGFDPDKPTWQVQAHMSAKLVAANVNKSGEAINIFLDLVQTPRGCSVSQTVRNLTRKKLSSACVVEAYDLDSRASDGLQVADLVASSIAYERREGPNHRSPKAQVSARLR